LLEWDVGSSEGQKPSDLSSTIVYIHVRRDFLKITESVGHKINADLKGNTIGTPRAANG